MYCTDLCSTDLKMFGGEVHSLEEEVNLGGEVGALYPNQELVFLIEILKHTHHII